jgi:hypothetical protein
MATVILHKRSSVPGQIPLPTELELGELALNVADGRVFIKDTNDSILDITGAVFVDVVPPSEPLDGQLWWDSTDGQLKIYYDDGVSAQFVDVSSSALGYTGSQGDVGFVGSQGLVGSKGFTGSRGSDGGLGFAGSFGFTGSRGFTGSYGYTGSAVTIIVSAVAPSSPLDGQLWWDSGLGQLKVYYNDGTSSQFVDANSGAMGYTGSQGVGYTGSQGIGFVGSRGFTGFVGSQGFTGSYGYTGSSVTILVSTTAPLLPLDGQLWWDSGLGQLKIWYNDGVHSQWVDANSGALGFSGSRGVIGFTGSGGATGYIGSQGFTGSTGFVGSQGFTGSIGNTGSQGFTGSRGGTGFAGSLGYTGSVGVTGFTGSFGLAGPVGPAGPIGSRGFTGSQGVGFTGSRGAGFTGSTGYTGSYGYTGSSVTIIVTTIAPVSPFDGQLWWDSSTGQLKIWYNDGTHSQWVDANSAALGYTGSQGYDGSLGYTGSAGAGFTGSRGATGFSGSLGFTGSQGNAGISGFTGSLGGIGFTGSQGVGFTGSRGDVGFTGSVGFVGSRGFSGSLGFTGSAVTINVSTAAPSSPLPGQLWWDSTDGQLKIWYDDGDTAQFVDANSGALGYTGSVGFVGSQGLLGFTGSAGFTGSTGFIGSRGFSGSLGFTGSAGAGFTGSAGTAGTTGFTGSLGFTGSAGAGFTGSAGAPGFTGSGGLGFTGSAGAGFTGSVGFVGSAGFTGSLGFTGSAGAGFTGSQGVTGFVGSLGFTGSRGVTGFSGSQGIQGFIGFTGSVGFVGSQGTIGFTGSAGLTGFTGSQGTAGSTGPTGGLGYTGSASTTTMTAFDIRTLHPSDLAASSMSFGFTSWNNDSASPYADYLLFRSFSDSSGGSDNLLTLRKDTFGLRVWQQAYGSSTAFTTFKDVAWSDGSNASGTWGISITGNAANITAYTINQNLGTSNTPQFSSLGVGTAASGTAGEIRATNEVTAYYSDERLKKFLGRIPDALHKVLSLNGYYFQMNDTARELGYTNEKIQVGVSAQEVQAVLPQVVVPAPIDDKYLTVRYEKLVPLLIEAIKELTGRVIELENLNGGS